MNQPSVPSLAQSVTLVGSLAIGSLALGAVLLSNGVVQGLAASAVATAGLAAGTWFLWPRRVGVQATFHVIAAIVLAMGGTGVFCADACGTYSVYAHFAGAPTAASGFILHASMAGVLLTCSGRAWMPRWVLEVGMMALVGGSLFYLLRMLDADAYCPTCMAAHVVMAVQAVHLLRATSDYAAPTISRAFLVAVLLASQMSINTYYHDGLPRERSDTNELLAVLRQVGGLEKPALGPSAAVWGRANAPSSITLLVSSRCPHCTAQVQDLADLETRVTAGQLQVRFLAATTGRRADVYRTASALAPDAGVALTTIYVDPAISDDDATTRLAAAAHVTTEQLLTAATGQHRATIARMAQETLTIMQLYGVRITPTAIITTTGAPRAYPGRLTKQRLTDALEP